MKNILVTIFILLIVLSGCISREEEGVVDDSLNDTHHEVRTIKENNSLDENAITVEFDPEINIIALDGSKELDSADFVIVDPQDGEDLFAESSVVKFDVNANTEHIIVGESLIQKEVIPVAGDKIFERIFELIETGFEDNPYKLEVSYETMGSDEAVSTVVEGTSEVAVTNTKSKVKIGEYGLSNKIIGYEVLAIVVHKDNKIDTITYEELEQIYKGEITNWKQLGGIDSEIDVMCNPDERIKSLFDKLISGDISTLNKRSVSDDIYYDSSDIWNFLENNRNSIGYVHMSELANMGSDTKILSIDGKSISEDNVINQRYPLCLPYFLVFNANTRTWGTSEYLSYFQSPSGEDILRSAGIVPCHVYFESAQ